jgi:hypothetical protein
MERRVKAHQERLVSPQPSPRRGYWPARRDTGLTQEEFNKLPEEYFLKSIMDANRLHPEGWKDEWLAEEDVRRLAPDLIPDYRKALGSVSGIDELTRERSSRRQSKRLMVVKAVADYLREMGQTTEGPGEGESWDREPFPKVDEFGTHFLQSWIAYDRRNDYIARQYWYALERGESEARELAMLTYTF